MRQVESTARRAARGRVLLAAALALGACAQTGLPPASWFPLRPVAWLEHDDEDVPARPRTHTLGDQQFGLGMRDFVTREVDRRLALETKSAALDVNALDEVPCSTWFCARNHMHPLSPAAVTAGPPQARPPVLPLTVVSSKSQGAAAGIIVKDATGAKYMVKLDPRGYPGMATAAEVIGQRLFHAAGYNVPGAFAFDLPENQLQLSEKSRFYMSGVAERPFTPQLLQQVLWKGARSSPGVLRVVAVPWLPGEVLGAFDMARTRTGDPNDRIPHQHRRSLRASMLLFGWLNVEDASALNTLDTYVDEGGRRFVRHYFIDFGNGAGSATIEPKGVFHGRERLLELGRMFGSLFTLGIYRRAWQHDEAAWEAGIEQGSPVGWFEPIETWNPEFRPGRKNPAHVRMTARDAYWGAKVVTSFTDQQIHAAVDGAGYDGAGARFVEHALRVRRDRIAERYLVPVTAVERPALRAGDALCFEDLVLARGYAAPGELIHRYVVYDQRGRPVVNGERAPGGPRVCLPLGRAAGVGAYLIVNVTSVVRGRPALPARVHLRRGARGGLVVVGIDRDG